MKDKLLTPEEVMQSAINHLKEPSFLERFRNVTITERGVGWLGYRPMTEEEIKARDESNAKREARNKALVDQAFGKLSQEEIEALELHYSQEFY